MIAITMRGALEPIIVRDEFDKAVYDMNLAAASGREFVLTTQEDGRNLAVALRNILTLQELEEDAFSSD